MNIACIAAAGSGTRMDLPMVNKQFLPLDNVPLIAHCVNAFNMEEFSSIVVAVQKIHIEQTILLLKMFCPNVKPFVIEGGASRNETILKLADFSINVLEAKDSDLIITHDAARPLVKKNTILKNIENATKYDCTGTAVGVTDSVYFSKDKKTIDSTIDRYNVFLAQTPQTFSVLAYKQLKSKLAKEDLESNMDICSLFHKYGFNVGFVKGNAKNIKITVDEDYTLAKIYKGLE